MSRVSTLSLPTTLTFVWVPCMNSLVSQQRISEDRVTQENILLLNRFMHFFMEKCRKLFYCHMECLYLNYSGGLGH